MIKKTIILILLASILSGSTHALAFFFKKSKTTKKETLKQVEVQKKKALLIQIYASWCPGCKNIQPTLDQLALENDDFELVRLDVSTPSKAKASAKKAEELKVNNFYAANKSKTATVAVIVPSTSEIVSVLQNNTDIDDYLEAIREAKEKEEEGGISVGEKAKE